MYPWRQAFALWEESDGDYKGFTPALGKHTLRVTPYKNGKPEIPLTLNFTITDEAILQSDKK